VPLALPLPAERPRGGEDYLELYFKFIGTRARRVPLSVTV
jgi:hypothetical protein